PWNDLLFAPAPIILINPRNLLHIWDRQTGEPVKLSASYHAIGLWGLAFSPDSSQLAVAIHKHISLIDIRERQEIHRFECGSNCEAPVFSPDGKFIAAYSWSGLAFHTRGFIQIWDVETGRKRAMNTVLTACGCSIAFAPRARPWRRRNSTTASLSG